MNDLARLLDWKLLDGSHEFPGPDGGTCINEAAIVVAGFRYRQVDSLSDLPPCFSRPISAYALRLNDRMDAVNRQRLIPFVPRLAGSADSREVERQRHRVIVVRTCREIVAPLFSAIGLHEHALKLANPPDLNAANAAYAAYAAKAANAAYAAYAAKAAYAAYAADAANAADAAYAAYAAKAANAADAAYAAKAAYAAYAAKAANAADAAYAAYPDVWAIALSILDEALCIGKQAEPIEMSLIVSRAEAAKRAVQSRETVAA